MDRTTQKLLEIIRGKLRRGDVSKLAISLGKSKQYVSKCLNPLDTTFNQEVIDAAEALIKEYAEAQKLQTKRIASLS